MCSQISNELISIKTDDSEITDLFWASNPALNFGRNKHYIQLSKEDAYKWRTSPGSHVYEVSDGWSVNKYICQCE